MKGSVAGLAKPRDGRWRRPGSNQDANSRAREGVAPQACRCGAARAKPPSRLRQGRGAALQACRLFAFRKGGKVSVKPMARTCVIAPHKRERQLAAPWRELLCGSTRRGRASSSCTSASVSSPLQGANRSVRARTAKWPVRPQTPLQKMEGGFVFLLNFLTAFLHFLCSFSKYARMGLQGEGRFRHDLERLKVDCHCLHAH